MSFIWNIIHSVLSALFGVSNEDFLALRAQANSEGDKMADAFERSKRANSRGNRALGNQLRVEGQAHKAKMEDLNGRASNLIFAEKNKDRIPGEIDLHGLYVKEAVERTKTAISDAKRQGIKELRLIVGKGLHSQGGAAKIRPAIEDLMRTYQLTAKIDPRNAGVLIVNIGNQGRSYPGSVGPEEIARSLEKEDGGCVIM